MLLEKSATLTQSIASGYKAMDAQWSQTRGSADTVVKDINGTAAQVAALNKQIRAATAAGTPNNELIDQRNTLTAKIAQLTGGTTRSCLTGPMRSCWAETSCCPAARPMK